MFTFVRHACWFFLSRKTATGFVLAVSITWTLACGWAPAYAEQADHVTETKILPGPLAKPSRAVEPATEEQMTQIEKQIVHFFHIPPAYFHTYLEKKTRDSLAKAMAPDTRQEKPIAGLMGALFNTMDEPRLKKLIAEVNVLLKATPAPKGSVASFLEHLQWSAKALRPKWDGVKNVDADKSFVSSFLDEFVTVQKRNKKEFFPLLEEAKKNPQKVLATLLDGKKYDPEVLFSFLVNIEDKDVQSKLAAAVAYAIGDERFLKLVKNQDGTPAVLPLGKTPEKFPDFLVAFREDQTYHDDLGGGFHLAPVGQTARGQVEILQPKPAEHMAAEHMAMDPRLVPGPLAKGGTSPILPPPSAGKNGAGSLLDTFKKAISGLFAPKSPTAGIQMRGMFDPKNATATTAPQPVISPAPITDSKTAIAARAAEVLGKYCYDCHGQQKRGGFGNVKDVALMRMRNLVIPGKPDESELLQRMEHKGEYTDDGVMPPKKKSQPSKEEIAAVRAWIAAGAPPFPTLAPMAHATVTPWRNPAQGDNGMTSTNTGNGHDATIAPAPLPKPSTAAGPIATTPPNSPPAGPIATTPPSPVHNHWQEGRSTRTPTPCPSITMGPPLPPPTVPPPTVTPIVPMMPTVPPPTVTPSQMAGPQAQLADHAKQVFERNCVQCHGATAVNPKTDFKGILDRNKMIEHGVIVPGNPEGSPLLARMEGRGDDPPMPPKYAGVHLSDQDKKAVRDWIAAGAPDWKPANVNVPRPNKLVTPRDVLREVAADQADLDPQDRPFMKYFSLKHLNASTGSADQPDTYRAALSRLINFLSRGNQIVVPKAIDKDHLLFRVDTRELQGDKKLAWTQNAWTELKEDDPFFNQTNLRADGTFTGAQLNRAAQRTVMGDWFIANASKGTNYFRLLGLANADDDGDLHQQLGGIDIQADRRNGRAKVAGFFRSRTEMNNRIIERHEQGATDKDGRPLFYWRSFNFGKNAGNGNILSPAVIKGVLNGKPFKHNDSDIIFQLPNGLHGYITFDGNGRFQADANAMTGLKCLSCHSDGTIQNTDVIRKSILAVNDERLRQGLPPAYTAAQITQLKKLIPTDTGLKELLTRDNKSFKDAIAAMKLPAASLDHDPLVRKAFGDPVNASVERYTTSISVDQAAAQAGLTAEQLVQKIIQSPNLSASLAGLLVRGPANGQEPGKLIGSIRRDTFDAAFKQIINPILNNGFNNGFNNNGDQTFQELNFRALDEFGRPIRYFPTGQPGRFFEVDGNGRIWLFVGNPRFGGTLFPTNPPAGLLAQLRGQSQQQVQDDDQ